MPANRRNQAFGGWDEWFGGRDEGFGPQPFWNTLAAELLGFSAECIRAAVLYRAGYDVILRHVGAEFFFESCEFRISCQIVVFIRVGSVIIEFLRPVPIADVSEVQAACGMVLVVPGGDGRLGSAGGRIFQLG